MRDGLGIAPLLAFGLVGCSIAREAPIDQLAQVESEAQLKAPIGESRYASKSRFGHVCPTANFGDAGCRTIRDGKVTIVGPGFSQDRYTHFYEVKINDAEAAFMPKGEFESLGSEERHQRQISEKKDCDRRGGVSVGMTKPQVLASCWGKPTSVNSTTTARGTHEQWVYGRSYLYFDETGHLTTIQN